MIKEVCDDCSFAHSDAQYKCVQSITPRGRKSPEGYMDYYAGPMPCNRMLCFRCLVKHHYHEHETKGA